MSLYRLATGGVVKGPGGGGLGPAGGSSGLQSTFAYADFTVAGAFGAPYAGPSDGISDGSGGIFAYARGMPFLRNVGGQTRLVMPTHTGAQLSGLDQDWRVADLVEMTIPATLSTTRAAYTSTLQQGTPTRRWRKNDWQGIGLKESGSGVMPGACWWDESTDTLWYTMFPYYASAPAAVLFAVKLNDPVSGTIGTCTRYGPWFFGTSFSSGASWKKVCHFFTEIPADERVNFGGKTHLVGGQVSANSSDIHWGLGLYAINLPEKFEEISGTGATGTSGSNVITITTATHDLSVLVPTDGTAAFYLSRNDGEAPIYTVPSSISKAGDTYTITGSVTLNAGQAAATPCYWSVCKQWTGSTALADFSPSTSGLGGLEYHQKRPMDYTNIQGVNLITGGQDPWILGRYGIADESSYPHQGTVRATTSTTVQLGASASTVDDAYNGKALVITGPAYYPYKAVRFISDYVGATQTATVDTAYDPAWIPVANTSTYTVKNIRTLSYISGWDSPSSAIPNVSATRGYWQSSMDCANSCIWIKNTSRNGVLLFGRQAYGDTWYHMWDTYGYYDTVCLARQGSGSYAYCANAFRPTMWQYDPDHLKESYAGTRPNNSTGMEVTDLGSWIPLLGSLAEQYSLSTGGYSVTDDEYFDWLDDSAEGACSCLMQDPNDPTRLIWCIPRAYHPGGDYNRPLFIVFNIPS